MKYFTLVAFSVERRFASAALFCGTHLEDMNLRNLPVDVAKALGSVRELVTRTLEDYRPEFVAIHCPSTKPGERTEAFTQAIKEIVHELGIPSMDVVDATLMAAYGHPPLRRREHVRDAARVIWPVLNDMKSNRSALDAVTTGLYVQTQRLFSRHEVVV